MTAPFVQLASTRPSEDAHPVAVPDNEAPGEDLDILALIGHELRTPLSTISAASELLQSAAGSPETEAFAGMLQRQVRRLIWLFDAALNSAGMLSATTHSKASSSPQQVLEEVAAALQEHDQRISVEFIASPSLPVVAIDADALAIALNNLVLNALKHSGGSHVRIVARQRGQHVLISVEDDGAGIAPQLRGRVFERGERGNAGGTRGHGLGLYVARRLVRLFGGDVYLDQRNGHSNGASFTVRLNVSEDRGERDAAGICIIGAGHVGLVYAAGLAELGHRVVCVDTDESRVEALCRGEMPIFEPGLGELVRKHEQAGTLWFTTSYEEALRGAEFAFIAVSTPSTPDGAADLRAVRAAARSIAAGVGHRRPVIVNKSTVPVGTGDSVDHILAMANGHTPFSVVANPEFLREGTAVHDFLHPDRIVLGSRDRSAAQRVAQLYETIVAPVVITDVKTAEMIKYASNAFLATKISFINEIAQICEAVGADAAQVAAGMGLDKRIGASFLHHGLGFGGSCLPKDVRALAYMGSVFGTHPQLLNAVLQINGDQRRRVLHKVRGTLGGLDGTRICVLGLAFKPETDDVRDAPAADLIRLFINEGAEVCAYDPQANDKMAAVCPEARYFDTPYDAAAGADAIIVATEWEEFRALDFGLLRSAARTPVLVDGRCFLDIEAVERAGFRVLNGHESAAAPPARVTATEISA